MDDHTTFSVKREPDFSPGFGFQSSVDKNKDIAHFDMDFASFLGEPAGGLNKPSELEPSELNSLIADGNLGLLDFLDPTTGVPTPAAMNDENGIYHVHGQPTVNNGYANMTSNITAQGQNGHFEEDRSTWLVEQSQKLERQQALQQQKLLELEQTLLKTEILKNRLEIVSNLQHASPTVQTQLLSALGTMPERAALSTVSQKVQLAASLSSPITTNPQLGGHTLPVSRIPMTLASRIPMTLASSPQSIMPQILHDDMPVSSSVFDDDDDEMLPGGKKKSHNLIEKKYRTSINDRIGVLRNIVSRHFKNDKKVQKSAVLQKTIDYIRYLENMNRKLRDENRQLKTLLGGQSQGNGYPLDSVGNSPLFQNSESSGDEDQSASSDVFLSDSSPNCSPPSIATSSFFQPHPSAANGARISGRVFMCLIMVICFFADPFSLSGGQLGIASSDVVHGSQRTLSSLDSNVEAVITMGWVMMWAFRCLVASVCFGIVWLYSIPKYNPEWEGVRFWRLKKQAEQDIKKSDFALAQIHLVSALTEVGLRLPTSYTSLALSLIWNGLSHVLFQIFVGRVFVNIVSLFFNKGMRLSSSKNNSKDAPHSVGHADVAQTLHLLHQISLAEYDGRTMHGQGFYLGLTALNFAEVGRPSISDSQYCDMLFTMGVQCQFSCVCITSLLARYYFVCAGGLNGLLSFASTDDGWEYLISKEWTRDVQVATQHYKGVSVFPKYSITRSFCRTLLTEAYRDLLLPQHQTPQSRVASPADITECLKVFQIVRDISRKTNGYIMDDIQRLTGALPTLSDSMSTRECGFEALLWWACMGLVACHWTKGDNKQCEELYPIIVDLQEKNCPVPTALHLAFKAQNLHRISSPPLRVLNQLCLTASQSLNDCGQKINSEDNLNLLGLLLACDWLLSLEYSLWEEHLKDADEETTIKQIAANFREAIDMLSHLATHLPGAFPLLSRYKGYQRLMCGGNPLFANTFLAAGGIQVDNLRHRDYISKNNN